MASKPEALFAAAVGHFQAGRFAAAEGNLRDLLRLLPNHPDVVYLAGVVASRLHKYEEAATLLTKAAAAKPGVAAIQGELSTVLLKVERTADAVKAARRAIAIDPRVPDAHVALAQALFAMGQVAEATAAYKAALGLNPANLQVLEDLANLYATERQRREAVETQRRILTLAPSDLKAIEGLIRLGAESCDWTDYEKFFPRLREAAETGDFALVPFNALMLLESRKAQLAAGKALEARFDYVRPRYRHARPRPADKLRIGYLCGNFIDHPTPYSIVEVIELHDRNSAETFAYSTGRNDDSPVRARIEKAFDTFRDLHAATSAGIADAIFSDRIDLLVDLDGHIDGARLPVLAMRPAPVQATWLGFPGTMGVRFIDAVIGDHTVTPASAQPDFAERIFPLPNCFFPVDRQRTVDAETPSRADVGLPENAVVFCSFNRANKITPEVFDSWMRIVSAIPGSALWLLLDDASFANLKAEAARRGVDPQRLVQAQRRPSPAHLARHRLADLMLDTYPYNAHTTAADALWVGLPMVTRMGPTFPSRVAASMLRAVGLPELVAETAEEFEGLAIRLANEPERLRAYRERLIAGRDTLAMFDTPRFTRDLEDLFREMVLQLWPTP
jgi:predicted O-linked N-acetylglucosamine transferase (SPINDLY family)